MVQGRASRNFDFIFLLQFVAVISTALLTLEGWPATAVGVIFAATWMSFWVHDWLGLKSDFRWSAAGFYYAGLPAIALIAIRQDPDYGFHAILYLFFVVWSADTGAYFTGRAIGGPKLAPVISPINLGLALSAGRSPPALRARCLPSGSAAPRSRCWPASASYLRLSLKPAIWENRS